MKILVLGGTRFFGIPMVNELLKAGHEVTIATRGRATDSYGDRVKRIIVERTDAADLKEKLSGIHFDVVIDKIAYCSNDIKYILDDYMQDFEYFEDESTYGYKKGDLFIQSYNVANEGLYRKIYITYYTLKSKGGKNI